MNYIREYKRDVPEVGTIHVGIDNKNNWYVELRGGKFFPVQIYELPIWVECRKWEAIPKKMGITEDDWGKLRADAQKAEEQLDIGEGDQRPEEEKYEPEIMERAKAIMKDGDVLEFMMRQYHKNHKGDPLIGMGWFCSFASGQSLTSNGIQPAAHSEDPGMGKTDSAQAAFHCIHTRRDLETSISAMSLYRDKSLRPGDIICSDDVEWSTHLTSTVKRAMSNFQRLTHHTTLDSNNELAKYSLPSRLLWWFTSVESAEHDQLVDRQFLFDVDDAIAHHEKVNDDIQQRREIADIKFTVDDEILISRAITKIIKKNGPFVVLIPFSKWINWKLPKSHRDLNKFYDLIDAFAILNFNHRGPVKREDGATQIKATLEDYWAAKKVFASRQSNIRTHLTDSETRLLNIMVNRSDWSQSELVESSGMKQGTISKRLNALLERSNYVKSWRVPGGEQRYAITDKVDIGLFANSVVDLGPIPVGRSFFGPGYELRYSRIFQRYSTLIPLLFPTITIGRDILEYGYSNNSKYPERERENDENFLISRGKEDNYLFGGGEFQKVEYREKPIASENILKNNNGISKEYDGNSTTRDHVPLKDFISEMERKEQGIKIKDLVVDYDQDEWELMELLSSMGWRELNGGLWKPPSRMVF